MNSLSLTTLMSAIEAAISAPRCAHIVPPWTHKDGYPSSMKLKYTSERNFISYYECTFCRGILTSSDSLNKECGL